MNRWQFAQAALLEVLSGDNTEGPLGQRRSTTQHNTAHIAAFHHLAVLRMAQHSKVHSSACQNAQNRHDRTAHGPAQPSPVWPFSNYYRFANQIVFPASTLHTRGAKLGSPPSEAPGAHAHSTHPPKGGPVVEGPWGGHRHGVGKGIPGRGRPRSW